MTTKAKNDLRTEKGVLGTIFSAIDVLDKENLESIKFDIPGIKEDIVFTVDKGELQNVYYYWTDYSLKDLRQFYQNISKAKYFSVVYKGGCRMICENKWNSETKQHKLNILAQKVA